MNPIVPDPELPTETTDPQPSVVDQQPPPTVVTSWEAPAWATRSDSDGGLVQHTRLVADVQSLDQQPGGAYVVEAVEVGQSDYVVPDGGIVRVEREAAEILCGPIRLDSAAARHLAASLIVAADIIDSGLVEQLPAGLEP